MNCKQAEKMISAGRNTHSLEQHLACCKNCSAYQKDMEQIRKVCESSCMDKNLTVPVSLDLSIKAAAANRHIVSGSSQHEPRKSKIWYQGIPF